MLAPPPTGGGHPTGALADDIEKTFGGLEGLKKAMVEESHPVSSAAGDL